jgi:hypothetical protein
MGNELVLFSHKGQVAENLLERVFVIYSVFNTVTIAKAKRLRPDNQHK